MEGGDSSAVFLESTRFWIQRVFVPILVFIGIGGNLITVIVLTRRRMRCSTNIYLTALAVADMVYLFFVLLLSFKHYPNIQEQKYELYWRFNGIIHWFCDAASNTSVWLTVSFTVERYIAVCHPMKGKRICTESRAKNIIAVVTIVCILSVASTAFERQLSINYECTEFCEKPITVSQTRNTNKSEIGNTSFCGVILYVPYPKNLSNSNRNTLDFQLPKNISNYPFFHVPCNFIKTIEKHIIVNKNDGSADNELEEVVQPKPTESLYNLPSTTENALEGLNTNGTSNNTVCCKKHYIIGTEETALGKNVTYLTIFSWFTAVSFAILPLILIATFNCFLVRTLYRSQRKRKTLTTSPESISQSNENRITLILIGVVIMFLICQSPTAIFLMYTGLAEPPKDQYLSNIQRGLGNIFNLLIAINASCNFLLYCVLSAKYRSTFRSLFCERRLRRQDTLALSLSRSQNSKRFNPNSSAFKRNATYCQTPRNLETQSLTGTPRSKSLMVRPPGKSKSCDFNF